MDGWQSCESSAATQPRLWTVLVFLAAFALLLSWIAVYAIPNALIAADLLAPFPADSDSRPAWMLKAFAALAALFILLAAVFHWLSARQLRRIDEMADAPSE